MSWPVNVSRFCTKTSNISTKLIKISEIGLVCVQNVKSVTSLTFRWPRNVINSYNKTNQMNQFLKLIFAIKLTCFRQFLCSSSGVFHCTHSNGICHTGLLRAYEQLASRIRTDPSWPCSQVAHKLSANLYDIYHCCVYSEKLLMMDRGTVRNTWNFNAKINLRNWCI